MRIKIQKYNIYQKIYLLMYFKKKKKVFMYLKRDLSEEY